MHLIDKYCIFFELHAPKSCNCDDAVQNKHKYLTINFFNVSNFFYPVVLKSNMLPTELTFPKFLFHCVVDNGIGHWPSFLTKLYF